MKNFLEFMSLARAQKIEDFPLTGIITRRELTDTEWDKLETCQPFLFSEKALELNGEFKIFDIYANSDSQLIDSPFPVYSIEFEKDGAVCLLSNIVNYAQVLSRCMCLVVVENSPENIDYYGLLNFSGGRKVIRKMRSPLASPIVKSCLDKIKNMKLGNETARTSLKIGVGDETRRHRIRRIIHVCPAASANNESENYRNVDWTHRFEVRGHWRKAESVGKNRDGIYCVDGYTWVSHHVRGPENMPLIKKLRVVSPNEPQQKKD